MLSKNPSINLDDLIAHQLPAFKQLILSVHNNLELSKALDSGNILNIPLRLKLPLDQASITFGGLKVRAGILCWAYFYPQKLTLRDLSKVAAQQVTKNYSLNPWATRPPLKFIIPLGVRAQSEEYLLKLNAEAEEDYYKRKFERQQARNQAPATTEEADDDEFVFID